MNKQNLVIFAIVSLILLCISLVLAKTILLILQTPLISENFPLPGTPYPAKSLDLQAQRELVLEGVRGLPVLSPDGQRLAAYVKEGSLMCVFSVKTLERELCAESVGMINTNSVAWSPDSRRVAFTEDYAIARYETDLWVLDIANGATSNLTDDGQKGSVEGKESLVNAQDTQPAWSPDGQHLAFIRSALQPASASLYRVAVKSGAPQKLLEISPDKAMPGPPIFWEKDKIFYNLEDGIWMVDENGKNPRKIIHHPEEGRSFFTDVAVNAAWALIDHPALEAPQSSTSCALLNIQSGEVSPIGHDPELGENLWVSCGVFSPDGSKILVGYNSDPALLGTNYLVAQDVTGASRTVLFSADMELGRQLFGNYTWAGNDTILLRPSVTRSILLAIK